MRPKACESPQGINVELSAGSVMKKSLSKYLVPVLIAVATLAYFFISPIVQQKMALRASSLTVVSEPLPPVTQDARMYVDQIRLSNVKDEVYQMDGWGFLILDSKLAPTDYERTILLVSDTEVFAIPTTNVPRKDVQKTFEQLGLDLKDSGFAGVFPMNAIPRGDYVISLLFTLPDGTQARYNSKFELTKTFNSMQLVLKDNPK